MTRWGLAQTRAEWRRLVAAAIAVTLGSMFVAATILGGGSFQHATLSGGDPQFGRADYMAYPMFSSVSEQQLQDLPAARSTCLVQQFGVGLISNARRVDVGVTTTCEGAEFQRGEIVEGRLPSAEDEIALDMVTATRLDVELGDTVLITVTDYAEDGNFQRDTGLRPTVVGILDMPSDTVVWNSTQVTQETFDKIVVFAPEESWLSAILLITTDSSAALEAQLANAPWVSTFDSRNQELQRQFQAFVGSTNPIGPLTWTFVGVALVVAVLVVATTFQMLVAQRAETIGLLRSVGATRRQIRNSVLKEALTVGIAGGVIGMALGHILVLIAVGVFKGLAPLDASLITFQPSVIAVIVPVVVGILVTLAAAYLPARKAMHTSPLAALRQANSSRTQKNPMHLSVGLILLATGVLTSWSALYTQQQIASFVAYRADALYIVIILGASLAAIGILLVAPVLFSPATTAVGWLVKKLSPRRAVPAVTVARSNLARNRSRTIATSNAVLVGASLVAMLATGAASARSSMQAVADGLLPSDVTVEPVGLLSNFLDDNFLHDVARLPGVKAVTPLTTAYGSLKVDNLSTPVTILIGDPDVIAETTYSPELANALKPGVVIVPPSIGFQSDQVGTISIDRGFFSWTTPEMATQADGIDTNVPNSAASQSEMSVRIVNATTPDFSIVMTMEDALKFGLAPNQYNQVWIRTDPGAIEKVREAVTLMVPYDSWEGTEEYLVTAPGQTRDTTLETIATAVTAGVSLLGISILIALVGVTNSLSLSVFERRREISLLRALGLTRSQLRFSLAAEGLIMTLAATVIGIFIGVAFGLAGASILFTGSSGTFWVIPWAALAVIVVVACVAGPIASMIPARTALQKSAVEGMTMP